MNGKVHTMTYYLYCFQCEENLIDQSDSWEELHDAYEVHYAKGHSSMTLTDERRNDST